MNLSALADKFNAANFESVKGRRFTPNSHVFISIEMPLVHLSEGPSKMRDALAKELVELGIISEKDTAQITVNKSNNSVDILATIINQDNLDRLVTEKDGFVARRTQELTAKRVRETIAGMEKGIENPAQRLLIVQKLLEATDLTHAATRLAQLAEDVTGTPKLRKEFDSLLVGYEAKTGVGRN